MVSDEDFFNEMDPYFAIKEKLSKGLTDVEAGLSMWLTLVEKRNTATSPEFKSADKDMHKKLKKLQADTLKMETACVTLPTNERAKFPNITDEDLMERRETVDSFKLKLSEMKQKMNNNEIRKKLKADRDEAHPEIAKKEKENTSFLADHQQQQAQIVQQQDRNLRELGQGVTRLQDIATTINVELDVQDKMLDDLDEDMDKAEEKMNIVMEGLAKLLKTRDTKQLCCIVVLVLILIILCALVIYS